MQMKMRARFVAPALLAAAAIPTIVLAQATTQPPADAPAKAERQAHRQKMSSESRARLQDGRFAMIKETLKLNDAQLKLWEPVETQMRSAVAERQKVREERREARRQAREQNQRIARPSLPERLDRASERMAKRAADMKAFAEAFKPFYESLDEEQKAVAGIVLRHAHMGKRGHGRRWAMHR
jgi:LTXXQ motif family protein